MMLAMMITRARCVLAALPMFVAPLASQARQELTIDPSATSIAIHVGKAGVFAFAGHTHEVIAPAVQGRITLDQSDPAASMVSIEFDAARLKVTGKGEPPEDVPEVQRVMLSERVLDVQRYPSIAFKSQRVVLVRQSGDRMELRLAGDLSLHGVSRPLNVPVTVVLGTDRLTVKGTTTLRQTDFGIQPVSAGAGTVRVKDEVEVVFSIVARSSSR
jgi:polyisoprenoid-binding protein YceI